jgi:hypothetical protein
MTNRKFSGTLNFPAPVKGGETALRRAGIDWTASAVDLKSLTGKEGGERFVAAVRDSDDTIIGVNGRRHEIVQNHALAELGDAVIQMDAGFAYTGGGAFPSGDKTYLILTGERNISFGGDDDKGFNAIMLVNDFNGNSPVTAVGFIGRLWCTNQIAGISRKRGAQRLVRISHTRSAHWHLAAAKDTLRALVHEMDDTERELQELLKIECSEEKATHFAVGDRPEPKFDEDGKQINVRAITTWEQKRSLFKAELNAPWNAHLSGTLLGAAMAGQGIDEHQSRSADRDKARVDRLITANFPTMKRVLVGAGR